MFLETASRSRLNVLSNGEKLASISANSATTAVASAMPLRISGADVMPISAYVFACIRYGVNRSEIKSECV